MAIFNGDIGTLIEIAVTDPSDVAMDISAATIFRIYYIDPDGTVGFWTAILKAATTDTIQFTTISGSISVAGAWKIQGYVALAAWTGRTTIGTLTVTEIVDNL